MKDFGMFVVTQKSTILLYALDFQSAIDRAVEIEKSLGSLASISIYCQSTSRVWQFESGGFLALCPTAKCKHSFEKSDQG